MKRCRSCGQEKTQDQFHRSSRSPDGFRPRCKACRVVESHDHYIRNEARIVARVADWKVANPEAASAANRNYRRSEKGRATRYAWEERTDKRARDRAYYAANSDAQKARARAHQAAKRGVGSESFLHREIFDRDGWICQLCGEPVDPGLSYPHPQSVSLDHIVPLALGGDHVRVNTQTSHLICNRRKGAHLWQSQS